ncbi:hypothetical protein BBAL3_2977 [Brevundimonas sp. BAL3]|nr:hypothetical protein BBAL3_2977 [Brevundimonas sp. BAL3]
MRDRRQGRETHYSARADALAPLNDWTGRMTDFWRGRFDELDNLLQRMDQ